MSLGGYVGRSSTERLERMFARLAVMLAIALCAGRLRAESHSPDDLAAADSHFKAGNEAFAAGDWAKARSEFERSQEFDESASTQARIAQCFEREGRLAAALQAYRRASALVPKHDNNAKLQARLRTHLPKDIAKLEPRVPKLIVERDTELRAHALTLVIDGTTLDADALDSPVLLDPGEREIIVRAPGFREERRVLRAEEGRSHSVRIAVATSLDAAASAPVGAVDLLIELVPEPAPTPPPGPVGAEAGTGPKTPIAVGPVVPPPGSSSRSTHPDEGRSFQRDSAWVLGGTGAVALGVAAYFEVSALLLVQDAECNEQWVCTEEGGETIRHAGRMQTNAVIAAGIGAVALGTGVVLLLTAPDHPRAPGVSLGIGPTGAWARGVF